MSVSDKEMIFWNKESFEQVFSIKGRVVIIHSARRQLKGIFINKKFRYWSKQLVDEYNEDSQIQSDQEFNSSF